MHMCLHMWKVQYGLPISMLPLQRCNKLHLHLLSLPNLHLHHLHLYHRCNHYNHIRNLNFLINHMVSHLRRLTLTIHIIQHTTRHMRIQHTIWHPYLHHQKVATRMICQVTKRWLLKPCQVLPILKGMHPRIYSHGWHHVILYNQISDPQQVRPFKKLIGVVGSRKVQVENID